MILHRMLMLCIVVSSLAFISPAVSQEVQKNLKPNVLIIMADDLGLGDLSSYGATDLKSPHIDRLVESGIRFDFAYANCPVCSPTRASLFTGRYPELVGVPGVIRTFPQDNWGYLSEEAVLLPQVLKRVGYESALIGKWHLGLDAPNRPNDRGFDFFHGWLGDMMDDYYEHRRHDINCMRKNEQEIDPTGHATDLFTEWACEYLRGRESVAAPFLLCLTYNAPHTPIQPPEDWLKRVKNRQQGISDQRAKLVALIEHMDDGIGRVLRTLEESGLTENTLVIFTSDNGGQLNVGANNGATRDGKQSMYQGGLRVPTCVSFPGRIKAGSSSDARILTMDILPTVCEIAGATFDHEIDGLSFLSVLDGDAETMPQRPLFFHRREGGTQYGGLTINAVIDGDWKLLHNIPFAAQELYNLKTDPLEKDDLASRNRGKFNELAAKLRMQVQRGGAIPWQKNP